MLNCWLEMIKDDKGQGVLNFQDVGSSFNCRTAEGLHADVLECRDFFVFVLSGYLCVFWLLRLPWLRESWASCGLCFCGCCSSCSCWANVVSFFAVCFSQLRRALVCPGTLKRNSDSSPYLWAALPPPTHGGHVESAFKKPKE